MFALVLAVAIGAAMVGTSDAAGPNKSGGHDTAPAAAAPVVTGRRVGWPCTGCITYIPTNYDVSKPTPIIVALHGDEGDPAYIESVWETAVKNRAIVFAPLCPTALGCRFSDGQGGYTNSWWAWLQYSSKYDDNWIGRQVTLINRSYRLDWYREFLTGWSGGADYLGWYAPAHGNRFAAATFVVGGVPYHPSCPAKKQAAYFLMGSNDFRYMSGQPNQVRNVYTSCGHATTQVVIPGATHQGTVDALTTQGYASKITTWFLAHPLALS